MSEGAIGRVWHRTPVWLRILVGGTALWAVIAAAAFRTHVTTLIPSLILLGSFLTPVAFLVWAFDRQERLGQEREGRTTALDPRRLAAAFASSGLLGVAAAAVVESEFLSEHPVIFYPGVAVVEEAIKLVILVIAALGLAHYSIRDGMVLGAAVGFGFAAFESAGYAFNAVIASPDADMALMIQTEAVRALLSPVGHGLWTALLGGALFHAAARNGDRLCFAWGIVGWYAVVVVLHALWDLAAPFAAVIAQRLTGEPVTLNAFETGRLADPTASQALIDGLADWALLTVCAAVGLLLARLQWHSRAMRDS